MEEEIIKFYKKKFSVHKVLQGIELRSSLPKPAVGRVLRKVLRDKEEAKQKRKVFKTNEQGLYHALFTINKTTFINR